MSYTEKKIYVLLTGGLEVSFSIYFLSSHYFFLSVFNIWIVYIILHFLCVIIVHLKFSEPRNVEYNEVFFLLICDVHEF